MSNPLFARKPVKDILAECEGENGLHRVLGPVALSSLGVGAIIGTGIFVLTGVAAHDKTGPALMLSFVVSGLACIASALCYSEFASMVPVAGSAYTYAYATLGELFAWIMGWDLILEYAVASSAVAHGWSAYAQDFFGALHLKLPYVLTNTPFDFNPTKGHFYLTGSWFDFPAVAIAAIITLILIKGIRESANVNTAMVITKLVIVAFVIVVGAFYVHPSNWHPFAPYGYGGLSFFGKTVLGRSGPGGSPLGMMAGAAIIFFAYIGFDSVSTHAEEANNPQRDVPIGIMVSLLLSTVLYIAVSAVLTGMVRYDQINVDAPISQAFKQVGLPWAQFLISIGAVAGITSVLLVLMLSGARVFLAMGRDGLLPHDFFGAVHPKFGTPWKSTILIGGFVAMLGGFLPLRVLADLVNIGTLLAFVIVCGAVIIMRRTHPEMERPFRTPLMPFLPIFGIAICLLLMFSLPAENWLRLFVWLGIGLAIYFSYGRHHSVLRAGREADAQREADIDELGVVEEPATE